MKKPMVITLKQLEMFGACWQARYEFKRIFGQRASITKTNIQKAKEEAPFLYNHVGWLSVMLPVSMSDKVVKLWAKARKGEKLPMTVLQYHEKFWEIILKVTPKEVKAK